jgi:hypothetical protein
VYVGCKYVANQNYRSGRSDIDPGQYECEMITQLMNGIFRDPHRKKFQIQCEVCVYIYIYIYMVFGSWGSGK